MPNASVSAWETPARSFEDPPTHTATTDRLGQCVVTVAAEHGSLHTVSELHPASSMDFWHTGVDEVVVDLAAMARVSGRVLWPDDRPAPGATVVFDAAQVFTTRVSIDRTVEADGQGRFELYLDAETVQDVTARSGSSQSSPLQLFVGAAESKEVVLYLEGAYRIEGVVLDAVGAPKVETDVSIFQLLADDASTNELFSSRAKVSRMKTDELGRFARDVPAPGRYQVLAQDERSLTAFAELILDEESPAAFVELEVPTPLPISGRVLWPDGEPVEGAKVSASAEGPENPMAAVDNGVGRGNRFPSRSTTCDANGLFRVEDLHPDVVYRLKCSPVGEEGEGAAYLRHVQPGTSGLSIVLDEESLRGAVLRGRVVTPEGTPVSSFTAQIVGIIPAPPPIYASSSGEELTFENAQGEFEFEHLVPGELYGVRVQAEGYPETGVEGIDMELPGREIEVVVDSPGALEVRVHGPKEKLTADVKVFAVARPFFRSSRLESSLDASGIARFEDCPPGEQYIMVRRAEETLASGEAVVTGGHTTWIDIEVQ